MPPKKKKAPPEEAILPPVDAPKPTMTESAKRRASMPYVFKAGQMNEMELMKEMVKMHATLKQLEYWMAIFEVGSRTSPAPHYAHHAVRVPCRPPAWSHLYASLRPASPRSPPEHVQ